LQKIKLSAWCENGTGGMDSGDSQRTPLIVGEQSATNEQSATTSTSKDAATITTILAMVVGFMAVTTSPMTMDTTNLTYNTLISKKHARTLEEPRKHLFSIELLLTIISYFKRILGSLYNRF
jgi:hypothetical protein